jgi:hypothetical protein
MNLLYYCNYIIPFGNGVPYAEAEWLDLALYRISYFQRENYNSVLELRLG